MPPRSLSSHDVLHCDPQVLVVNKPPGLLSQADHTGDADLVTLGKAFLEESGAEGEPFLAPAHRLDRPASGVLVLARSSKAARHLTRQFRERLVDKRYLAIVEGTGVGFGTLEDYIAKSDATPRLTGPGDPEGRYARLQYQTLAEKEHQSLLLVQLETGRPHQVRLQLSERGYPILGDLRYGAQEPLDGRNLALHGYFLAFEHPQEARRVTFSSAPPGSWPEYFAADVQQLLQHAG